MFYKSRLVQCMLLAMAVPGAALAEVEVTYHLKNETAVFAKNGNTIGSKNAFNQTGNTHNAAEAMKFENSVKAFINGDIGEESTWHAELQMVYDPKAADNEGGRIDYRAHEDYTQQDYLRELYVDTNAGGWDLRLGKQQVVWGTADGIKLLDIINPTDFREVNQNTFEDSRIPIWMINAERNVGENGNFQFVVSQVEENKIPGLSATGDQGQPFIMKGVDSITGKVNGFLNIAPALGLVSTSFSETARLAPGGSGFDVTGDGTPDAITGALGDGLTGFGGLTVAGFAGRNQFTDATPSVSPTVICSNPLGCGAGVSTATDGGLLLNNFTQATNNNVTNLTTVTYEETAPDSTFEYMPMATFATFSTFAASSTNGVASINSEYVRDYPDDGKANAGFRFKQTTSTGLNYSLNYFYHYDANPVINTSWHDAQTKAKLTTVLATNGAYANGYFADPNGDSGGTTLTRDQARAAVRAGYTPDANGNATNAISVLLRNSSGQYYGATNPNANDGTITTNTNGATLRFTESLNRIHSLGASFDFAIDTTEVPLVVRGEFLYDRDTQQPIVDKALLSIGDLEGGLTTQDSDMFKYVLGLDATVMTNLLISGQFIQFINLDFVEDDATCTTQVNTQFDCSRYTADPSTLHLSNGLQKGWEYKEFVSLFFSKPIGEDQLGRWNNITIFEEGGGWWNRLDAEYSVTDEFIVSGEINMYFGDDNTTFGQLEDSSNIQIGLKYILE